MKQEIARETSHDKGYTKVSGIPFADIPGQSPLFLAYLSNPTALRQFYPNVVDSPLSVTSYVSTLLENYKVDRTILCDALLESNRSMGSGAKALANIDLLRQSDTVAIVTGQQAGLFSGPLYTVYKALSAVKLALSLSEVGVKAVPVFWMATEDHDFEEVSKAVFLARNGKVSRVHHPPPPEADVCVGSVEVDVGMGKVIESVFAQLPETEFSTIARSALETAWKPGEKFGDAFGKTLAHLLGAFGLILLDPLHPIMKRLAAPIYERAIVQSEQIAIGLVRRNAELAAAGFHAQVSVEEDHFPLFWHDESGRRTAFRQSKKGRFRAKGSGRELSLNELRSFAENEPDRLSPGVMLRSVVQDYLLPTAAYFGGGAEISYWAQNSVVYETLGRPVTPIFHRQSFTIVDAKHRRTMERFGIGFESMFDGKENVLRAWANANADSQAVGLFSSAEESINTQLHRIDEYLASVDGTLLDNLAKRRRKMLYHIGALREKTLLALVRRNGDAERRITGLFASILPDGGLQERSLNIFSLINRYGPNLIDWIYASIDLKDKRHRILDI